MAIRDLLWACPCCGTRGGLRKERKIEVCGGCGTKFRRVGGAMIEAVRADGGVERRHARDWLDRLPPLRIERLDDVAEHVEVVQARFADGWTAVRHRGRHLNFIERFGRPVEGELRLGPNGIEFLARSGKRYHWPLDQVTAVQSSSRTLQVNSRIHPLVSFRFPTGSAHYWEELLREALRVTYRAAGKGEIIEFQPRIVTQ